ncbi:MAG: FtsX-like permease family protein [Fulvivirga sp.]|uniref:ABC transporter permease n=1 Tax=Fulvivirga sp. TaxID=1931237 RepID=UPI0032EF2F83
MLKNFLKITFRSVLKQKLYSSLNVLGLAIGLASTIIILIYAHHELTYDQFHKNSDSIFMAYKERITPNGIQPTYDTWVPMGERMEQEYPEVVSSARFIDNNAVLEIGDERFEGRVAYSDQELFEIFDFSLKQGDNANPFPTDNSIIISEEMATRYFGTEDPMGKVIRVDSELSYSVTGVLNKIPTNSSIQIDHLISLKTLPVYSQFENDWGASFLNTYILLNSPSSAVGLEAKFPNLITNIWNEEVQSRTNFKLLPLHDVYDTLLGDTEIAMILLYIAAGILFISGINFVNLYTSSALVRSKEIGVKKVIGSSKKQLISQFLGESLLITTFSMVLALLVAQLCLPLINSEFNLQLVIPFSNPLTYVAIFSLIIIIGLLSGGYPAFIMSRFGIISSLKGSSAENAGKSTLRDLMIAFQFMISILLIVGTMVISNQIQFLKTTDMGFDKNNLVVIPLSIRNFSDGDSAVARVETYKNELLNQSDVVTITNSRHIPTDWTGSHVFVRPEGWTDDPMRMAYTYHDAKFFQTYGIEIIHGKNFNDDSFGDQRESVVLNKAAMEAFGFTDVNGQVIKIGDDALNVVGVIDDFNFETMKDEIRPILHFHRQPSNATHNYVTVKTKPGKANEVIQFAKEKWPILNSEAPFEYLFIDDNVERMYEAENRLLLMSTIFSGVAIIVACLGLFGIVSFNVEQRKKEIGIRKVLGASVLSILKLISKKFALLILIGFAVSIPIGLYFMNNWLDGFAYHTSLSPLVFVITLLAVIIIAFITISARTVQAGLTNPINVLREN